MEVRYRNKKIEKICTNVPEARKAYGPEMARKIDQRIGELSVAENVDVLILRHVGHCHRLTGDRAGQYAMDLAQPYRLIFLVMGDCIQIVEVQEIVDYH